MLQKIEAEKIGIVTGDNAKSFYKSPLVSLLKPSLCTFIGAILFILASYFISVADSTGILALALRALDMAWIGAVFIGVGEFWDYQIKKAD
jgi:hypothetical protein